MAEGVIRNAFTPRNHKPHLNDVKYDEYYVDVQLVDKVVKTGEGEEDFSIVKKEVITKRSIKEVIDSQADDVGLENILRKFSLTGDESILPEKCIANDEIIDFSAMPQDLIDANNAFNAMRSAFDALPDELKQGRDFASFMQTLTQKQFDDFINSQKPKEEDNKKKGEGE